MLCQKTFCPNESCHKRGKNNLCIPQTTSKMLFCYCSLVVEIFQRFRQRGSYVGNFFGPLKYVKNGKNNENIPQFYHNS